MLDDASSSVNDNSVFIAELTETPSGVMKIALSDGRSFITRLIYFNLDNNNFNSLISEGSVFSEDAMILVYSAVRRYAAECKALDYLNRAEQSRFMLEQKLFNKQFLKQEFTSALDFLESKGYLDDYRFAESWVRSRLRTTPEGKIKLQAGLYKKGISRQIAHHVLTDYFQTNYEDDLCKKAIEKQLYRNNNKQKIIRSMLRKGFSFSTINQCLSELDYTESNFVKCMR